MSVAQPPPHHRVPVRREGEPGSLTRWAVGLAAAFGGLFTVSAATIAVAYGVGVASAVEDTLFGLLLGVGATVGVAGSLAGFVTAMAATFRGERSRLLWVPLVVLPAILLFLALGEAFWWE